MSAIVNTNLPALSAQRAALNISGQLVTSLQRLTSGLRINSSKDDAAGLAIAERLTTQVRGYNQAIRNAGDGISVAQTAEGGLDSITTSLQRIRELAVQSANFTNTLSDRTAINQEATQMKDEIERVASQTKFNGLALLDGTFSGAVFQVGANVGETITVTNVGDMRTGKLVAPATVRVGLSGAVTVAGWTGTRYVDEINLSTAEGANAAIQIVDGALATVSSARAQLGATMNRFEQTVNNLRITAENQTASRSRIQDADFAAETAALMRAKILQQSGIEFLQLANAVPRKVLQLLS